jgi:hypothetical protein
VLLDSVSSLVDFMISEKTLMLIDWVFLSIDTLGGLFSLFALGTIKPIDLAFPCPG